MTNDELGDIVLAVVEARSEWEPVEVREVLVHVLANREGVTIEQLRRAALHVAAQPGARTPWALTGAGGQWSASAQRDVLPPRMLPQPPPVREVIEPDPYRGNEDARSQSYGRGAALAREALKAAGVDREREQAERERREAQDRAARRAVAERMRELSAASKINILEPEVVDW